MYVVLANRSDQVAPAVVEYWQRSAGISAALLTCADLSVAGWRHQLGRAQDDIAQIAGHRVAAAEIRGVVTRLPAVRIDELSQIVAADRTYVAQEMTAFLLSWLTKLRCPLVNPPTAMCLAGKGWRQEQWLSLAAKLGIPVVTLHRQVLWHDESDDAAATIGLTNRAPYAASMQVIVVGEHCFGATDGTVIDYSLRLSAASNSPLLELSFRVSDAALLSVNPWPDISGCTVADALLEHLKRGNPC